MKSKSVGLLCLLVCSSAWSCNTAASSENDRATIVHHIEQIFEAYVRQDRAAIKRLHASNWHGFLSASREIVRDIDGYMELAERSLAGRQMRDYHLDDVDVQIHGDIGLVYYIATITSEVKATGENFRIRLRALDAYKKKGHEWNQIGSNLNVLTAPGSGRNPECVGCFDVTPVTSAK